MTTQGQTLESAAMADVADDDGLRIDVGGFGDARGAAAVGAKQCGLLCVGDASIGETDVTMPSLACPWSQR